MTSQLVIFRAFLFIYLLSPPTLYLKTIPSVNQLIKKFWPKNGIFFHFVELKDGLAIKNH